MRSESLQSFASRFWENAREFVDFQRSKKFRERVKVVQSRRKALGKIFYFLFNWSEKNKIAGDKINKKLKNTKRRSMIKRKFVESRAT